MWPPARIGIVGHSFGGMVTLWHSHTVRKGSRQAPRHELIRFHQAFIFGVERYSSKPALQADDTMRASERVRGRRMKLKLGSALIRTAILLSLAYPWLAVGQETSSPTDKLTQFSNMDSKETSAQLTRLQQELYQEEVETRIVAFETEYGRRVHLEPVMFPSTQVSLIPGYLFTPANMGTGKRYPGVVLVHGGFHDHFDRYLFRLIVAIVEQGYIVIFPDYRGSAGYGEIHYQNSYGTADVDDVLSSADFLSKQRDVEPGHIGIVGHSRGGMVTLLAIERAPKKFKAAVEIAGLVDFLAYMSYKPDFRRAEVAKEPQFGGQLPSTNLGAYMKVSPINYVSDIQSPLLVLANTFDETVPFAVHSGRLIDLLKANGKVFDAHVYANAPGGHMFPFGDTDEGQDVFRRTLAWLDKYLKP
jgi:dipeptidyl aminopeptidase/acylaminoacyl peptidase